MSKNRVPGAAPVTANSSPGPSKTSRAGLAVLRLAPKAPSPSSTYAKPWNPAGTVGPAVRDPHPDVGRQPGLARTADPDQGHQSALGDKPLDGAQLSLAPDERRQLPADVVPWCAVASHAPIVPRQRRRGEIRHRSTRNRRWVVLGPSISLVRSSLIRSRPTSANNRLPPPSSAGSMWRLSSSTKPSRSAWSTVLAPPTMYTFLSPAAAFACAIALSTSVTNVKVVAPATRTSRGRCVGTKTGILNGGSSPQPCTWSYTPRPATTAPAAANNSSIIQRSPPGRSTSPPVPSGCSSPASGPVMNPSSDIDRLISTTPIWASCNHGLGHQHTLGPPPRARHHRRVAWHAHIASPGPSAWSARWRRSAARPASWERQKFVIVDWIDSSVVLRSRMRAMV